jgi:uncharacterized membrane protein
MKHLKTILIIIIGLIALYFVVDRALPYFYNFSFEQFQDYYWPNKWWLVGHLLGGITALIIGPFQFSTSFRNRYLKIHRTLGKIFIIAIIIGSFCAIYMSFTVAQQVNIPWSISLFVLALVWLVSALMAYRMIRLKRIPQHREWMIRTYVITFAFVLFRFINESSIARSLMETFEERGPTAIWLSWAVPLFFTEVVLQWNKKK